jgi:hypothetical protein
MEMGNTKVEKNIEVSDNIIFSKYVKKILRFNLCLVLKKKNKN